MWKKNKGSMAELVDAPDSKSGHQWGSKKKKTINKVIDHNYQDVANL